MYVARVNLDTCYVARDQINNLQQVLGVNKTLSLSTYMESEDTRAVAEILNVACIMQG